MAAAAVAVDADVVAVFVEAVEILALAFPFAVAVTGGGKLGFWSVGEETVVTATVGKAGNATLCCWA